MLLFASPSHQDEWQVYDAPSLTQIEAAFQAGQAAVDLSSGYFARQPHGAYSITFDRSGGAHFQVNRASNMQRRVRRIAADDSRMFVPAASWQAVDLCPICQEGFPESAAAPGAANVVHLSSCAHVFHRECISAEIKLRGKCPLCKRSV